MKRKMLALLLSAVMMVGAVAPVYATDIEAVSNVGETTDYVNETVDIETDETAIEDTDNSDETELAAADDSGLATGDVDELQGTVVEEQLEFSDDQNLDEDDLLEEYLFAAASDEEEDEKEFNLSDDEQTVFNELKKEIVKVASGELNSTQIGIDLFYTYSDLEVVDPNVDCSEEACNEARAKAVEKIDSIDKNKVGSSLFASMPYEFYWCMQHEFECVSQYTLGDGGINFTLTFKFKISDSFRSDSSDWYTMDTDKAQQATDAATEAQKIVNAAASKNDYDKIMYYKEQICDLVTYDTNAAASGGINAEDGSYDGDPWQVISVFDGDVTTNVVCEGYSKAFQLLCDKTSFDNSGIKCLQVTGTMNDGNHMWNLMIMDDKKSYLVDVTNSDEGSIGQDGGLFLAGTETGSVTEGYKFTISGQEEITYKYDEYTTDIFSSKKLTLSSTDYSATAAVKCKHTNIQTTQVNRVEYCEQSGSYTEVKTCADCHTELSREQKTIEAQGHAYGEWTVTQAATCTKKGIESKTCTRCKTVVSRDIEIDSTNHEWAEAYTVDTPATCTATGSQSIHCKNCAETKDVTEIPAKGHTYVTTTTPATLTTNGSAITKCSACEDTKSPITISYPKTITLAKTAYTYTGKAMTPAVTVKAANGAVIAASNYTVSYPAGRVNVGTYTVKITFKGNYTGAVSRTFAINPKGTTLKKLKAAKKKFTVSWNKQAAQTSGYQIQYALNNKFTGAKTVTTAKNSIVSYAVSKLASKKTYYVRIRTYKTVGKVKYYSGWSAVKSIKTK